VMYFTYVPQWATAAGMHANKWIGFTYHYSKTEGVIVVLIVVLDKRNFLSWWPALHSFIRLKQRTGWLSDNAIDLYSGDTSFESRPGPRLYWLTSFVAFPQPIWANVRKFPSPSTFIIHHPVIDPCRLATDNAVKQSAGETPAESEKCGLWNQHGWKRWLAGLWAGRRVWRAEPLSRGRAGKSDGPNFTNSETVSPYSQR
jgi:hypothetical protein